MYRFNHYCANLSITLSIIPDVGKAPLQGGAYLSKGGHAHGSLPRLLLVKGVSARSLRPWQYMLFHYRARITAGQVRETLRQA